MSMITPIQRYLPHELHTRILAVKLYRSEHEISFVCRRYKVSKSSLLRRNKRYDGTPGSLMDRSHRPHTPHPNSHTLEEIKWVRNLVRRTPDISCPELWWKLHRKKRATTAIPAPCAVSSYALACAPEKLPARRKSMSLCPMILPPPWASNGRWMSNTFRLPAMPVRTGRNSTNIR